MEYKQLLKMLGGAVIFALIVLAITMLLPGTSKADMDSNTRNPGVDKQGSIIEKRVIQLGTAMRGWAVAFGSDLKKSGEASKKAFLTDVDRIKQSEFVQYQKQGFEQAKQQLARNHAQLKGHWQNIADALASLAPKKQ